MLEVGGCNGVFDVPGTGWAVLATSAAPGFSAAPISPEALSATGAFNSSGIEVLADTSTLRGVTGGGVSSTLGVFVPGVTGSAVGQLLTPPACTVLHQGQRIGSVLAAGADGGAVIGSAGFSLRSGSGARSGTTGWLGFDATTETVGWDASG